MDNVPLFYERLTVLVGLVIRAIVGIGVGALVGQIELLGFVGRSSWYRLGNRRRFSLQSIELRQEADGTAKQAD